MLRKQISGVLFVLSLMLGAAGAHTWAGYQPAPAQTFAPKIVSGQTWWGSLYPEYCLPGALELVTEKECGDCTAQESGTGLPVKIRFKYLTFLNHKGEHHE